MGKEKHPLLRKTPVGIKLTHWMLLWTADRKIETGESRAKQVENAVLDYYHIEPPDTEDID